ncbi:MAG: hypothetical protein IJF90_09545 [Synergistaceae bacterium]|nr:hypothetical protein [Synergistaceae bacterium]
MPGFVNNNAASVAQLHVVMAFVKQLLKALEARIDIQVTATTEPDADYAAEVLDGRVDIWANEHGSIGANIRDGQQRVTLGLRAVQESHQEQLDELAEARFENLAVGVDSHDRRRQEISTEGEIRINDDERLQAQINSLSDAVLHIGLQLSELREKLRQEE